MLNHLWKIFLICILLLVHGHNGKTTHYDYNPQDAAMGCEAETETDILTGGAIRDAPSGVSVRPQFMGLARSLPKLSPRDFQSLS